MITENDVKIVEAIKKDIDKRVMTNETKIDWKAVQQIEVLDRLVNNLRIANVSYCAVSDEDKANNYYTAECGKCDWWGSSKLLEGGGSIADTGDYFDCTCPVCGNDDVGERHCS